MHRTPSTPKPTVVASERGVVLIYAIAALLLITGIVFAGSMRDISHNELQTAEFALDGHARQIAESGLVDAVAWFRNQATQPVTEFAPRRDLTASPIINETDDESIGLVREFRISRGLWGRYVVRHSASAEPYTDENKNGYFDPGEAFEDLDGNGRRTMSKGVKDVSDMRGSPKAGVIWYVESEGSVYRRLDKDKPLGEGRNTRLARVTMGTEVRRLSVVIPASAGLVFPNAEKAKIEGAYINSPVLGAAYRPDFDALKYSVDPNDEHRVIVDAPIEHAAVPGWVTSGVGTPDPKKIRVEDVFGVNIETLQSLADFHVSGLAELPGLIGASPDPIIEEVAGVLKTRMPYTFPEGAFIVITPSDGGKVVFDETSPLIGSGILVVDGDAEVKPLSNSDFSGILFVTGKLKIDRSGYFRGITIAGKELEVHGHMATTATKSVKLKTVKSVKNSVKTLKTFKTTKTAKTVKTKKTIKTYKEVTSIKSVKVAKTKKSGKTKKTRKTYKTCGKTVKTKKTIKTKKTVKTIKSCKIKTAKSLKSLKSTPEESVWFSHDPALVERLIRELGRYRRWKASYRPVPTHEDGRPDELFKTAQGLRRKLEIPDLIK